MVIRRPKESDSEPKRPRPATTPDAREAQLISYATDLAEKQLLNGTASAQVISHYLKLGSSRERLEQERLEEELRLTRIKADAIESEKRVEQLYSEAIRVMRLYQGQEAQPSEDDYEN